MPEKRIGNHAICMAHKEVLSDGGRPVPVWSWVNPISISPAQAALGAMTEGEVATVLWRRHLYRRAPDMLTAEGKDHKEQLLKRGLWPPEGAESGE